MAEESLFDYLEADDSDSKKASRVAMRVANKRFKDRFSEFLGAAENLEDYNSRLDLVSEDIKSTVHEVVSEYGGDPASIEASLLRSAVGPLVNPVTVQEDGNFLASRSSKVTSEFLPDERPDLIPQDQYEGYGEPTSQDPLQALIQQGYSPEEAQQIMAEQQGEEQYFNQADPAYQNDLRGYNLENEEPPGYAGDDDWHMGKTARKPKLCPYHSEVTDIALATGDPRAGFESMAQHAWGPQHCQGEGFEGRCNFKREMVTQSYWDEKAQQADERKQQRQLERERLLEMAPQAPEGEIGDAPEPELVEEPKDINQELSEAPSAVAGEPIDSEFEPALAKTYQVLKDAGLKIPPKVRREAEADRDGGGAVKTEDVGKGKADGPVPEMDKTRWTPFSDGLEDIDTEADGSPVPTQQKDILEKIPADRDDNFLDETNGVLEQQELPSANDDGYTTDKNIDQPATDTWSGNNGASPVAKVADGMDTGYGEGRDQTEGFEDQAQPPISDDMAQGPQQQQFQSGDRVVVHPRLGPGESIDTEGGAQPWEAHFVGYDAEGNAIIDDESDEKYGPRLRKMDPSSLTPARKQEPDLMDDPAFQGRGEQPLDANSNPDQFQSSVDPDKNPIRQVLEDGFVPHSQAEEAISQHEGSGNPLA